MSEQLAWTDAAWKDYLYWQTQDKKHSNVLTNLSPNVSVIRLKALANLNP